MKDFEENEDSRLESEEWEATRQLPQIVARKTRAEWGSEYPKNYTKTYKVKNYFISLLLIQRIQRFDITNFRLIQPQNYLLFLPRCL